MFPARLMVALLGLSFLLLGNPSAKAADPAPSLTKAQAREFTLRWFPAWVGGAPSVDKLLAFYAPTAVYQDPNVPKGIQGTENLRPFFTQMLTNHPDWKFRIVEVYPTEKGFILNWIADIPWKDKVIKDYKGVDILEFDRDGLISRHEDYFDLSVFK